MSRLAYDAVSGVSPVTDVPPRPTVAVRYLDAAEQFALPPTVREMVTAAIHAEQRRRERELRQVAFLLFGAHL